MAWVADEGRPQNRAQGAETHCMRMSHSMSQRRMSGFDVCQARKS